MRVDGQNEIGEVSRRVADFFLTQDAVCAFLHEGRACENERSLMVTSDIGLGHKDLFVPIETSNDSLQVLSVLNHPSCDLFSQLVVCIHNHPQSISVLIKSKPSYRDHFLCQNTC